MSQPWVVLKFGGTSVAGGPQWEAIAELVARRRESGRRVLVVCSAVAGVTDSLVRLSEAEAGETPERLSSVIERHRALAAQLGVDAEDLFAESSRRLEACLAGTPAMTPAHLAEVLAEGEWLSSRLGQRFLASRTSAEWVDARSALRALPEPDPLGRRAWLGVRCGAATDAALAADWNERAPVLITQGFVVQGADGGTALLGRGGSDTSAALLGGRLGAERVEIWTDVPGLFSADPRSQPAARLLPRIGYAEALEMAAGGARVIHGRAIRAAAELSVPLAIRDLANPDAPGTLIDAAAEQGAPAVRAVVRQPDMLVLLLENLDTRQQVGFLAAVFREISDRGVSVDLVATSETTTTLAIHRPSNHLDDDASAALVQALRPHCRVQRYPDCACVHVVGRGARMALARLGAAREFLNQRPLLMASQSANDLSLSLVVHAGDAPALEQLLHQCLVVEAKTP